MNSIPTCVGFASPSITTFLQIKKNSLKGDVVDVDLKCGKMVLIINDFFVATIYHKSLRSPTIKKKKQQQTENSSS